MLYSVNMPITLEECQVHQSDWFFLKKGAYRIVFIIIGGKLSLQ